MVPTRRVRRTYSTLHKITRENPAFSVAGAALLETISSFGTTTGPTEAAAHRCMFCWVMLAVGLKDDITRREREKCRVEILPARGLLALLLPSGGSARRLRVSAKMRTHGGWPWRLCTRKIHPWRGETPRASQPKVTYGSFDGTERGWGRRLEPLPERPRRWQGTSGAVRRCGQAAAYDTMMWLIVCICYTTEFYTPPPMNVYRV